MTGPAAAIKKERLEYLDAFRGTVMFLMMAEALRLSRVSHNLPESGFWEFMSLLQTHVEWRGFYLHDIIQPSFSFLVGAVLPYSIASRLSKGQSFNGMFVHALKRSLILILLGIFLRSQGRSQTYFTFEDTLTQIGLGYPLLFMLGFKSKKTQLISFIVIVAGYFIAFALYTPDPAGYLPFQPCVPPGWEENAGGFAAHWNKNANLAWRFDVWFLNLFPREKPFVCNEGGYATLSFVPTLATMIAGLLAGNYIKAGNTGAKLVKTFLITGVAGFATGLLLDITGICPNVKRIWTPSWVLFSGGLCLMLTAFFYWAMAMRQWRKPFFWLIVIGSNSIAAYLLADMVSPYFFSSWRTHIGQENLQAWAGAYRPLVEGVMVLAVEWLILYWMYRKKIFIKI
jgi:predicted acyltransferase